MGSHRNAHRRHPSDPDRADVDPDAADDREPELVHHALLPETVEQGVTAVAPWIGAVSWTAALLFVWALCRTSADGDAELDRQRPHLVLLPGQRDPRAAAMAAHPAGKARTAQPPLRVVKDTPR